MRKMLGSDSEGKQAADVGVSGGRAVLTVTLGAQKFAPVQYHSFDVGPYVAQVELEAGETFEQARERTMSKLRAMADADFAEQLQSFLQRVKLAAGAARGGR